MQTLMIWVVNTGGGRGLSSPPHPVRTSARIAANTIISDKLNVHDNCRTTNTHIPPQSPAQYHIFWAIFTLTYKSVLSYVSSLKKDCLIKQNKNSKRQVGGIS